MLISKMKEIFNIAN